MSKYWLSIIGLFLVDRLTKIYFINYSSSEALQQAQGHIGGDFFSLHLNKDIAFSIPLPSWLLYPFLIIILIALVYFWKKAIQRKSILIWPLGLLTIGAVSNLMDRVSYGAIVDFINFEFWPVFNLSDVYISLGVIWLLVWELRRKKLTKV